MKKHFNLFLFSVLFLTGFLSEAQRAQFDYVENAGRNQKVYVPTVTVSDYFLSASATQVIKNKDVDGQTASNSSRLTIPKAAKSTLNGLTRKEATIVYASDEDKVYADDGATLKALSYEAGSKNVAYQSISTSQTVSVDYDVYAVSAASGDVTLTLPTLASSLGKVFTIKKTDASANKVIIDGNSTEQVEGGNDFRIFNQNDTVKIANISSSWIVISANIKKEMVSFNSGNTTSSCTADTWITAPLSATTDSTRYPLTSNSFIIRKTAQYCFIMSGEFSANGEFVYLTYSVNAASESSNYLNSHNMDSNASGSWSMMSEHVCRSFTAGDVIRMRVRTDTNTRSCKSHMFTIWEN